MITRNYNRKKNSNRFSAENSLGSSNSFNKSYNFKTINDNIRKDWKEHILKHFVFTRLRSGMLKISSEHISDFYLDIEILCAKTY